MTQLFVNTWYASDFDIDEDGGEYNTSSLIGFTEHLTFEEAAEVARASDNYAYYAVANGLAQSLEEAQWCPLFVNNILVYEGNELIGLYSDSGFYDNPWRFYERLEHWNEYHFNFIHYPPFIDVAENDYLDGYDD